MRYLTVSSFGTALGLSGERLVVHEADGRTWETALSRLRTIRIEKKGISISTNLMLACAARGIRMFLVDWRGVGGRCLKWSPSTCCRQHTRSAVSGNSLLSRPHHRSRDDRRKIRNQRTVLLYFWKYLNKSAPGKAEKLREAADTIANIVTKTKAEIENLQTWDEGIWSTVLMGYEGAAATLYWQALRTAGLVPETFLTREGRAPSKSSMRHSITATRFCRATSGPRLIMLDLNFMQGSFTVDVLGNLL